MKLKHRWIALVLLLAGGSAARADIFNWQTSQIIPGTAGIVPGPNINLVAWNTASHNLQYADLSGPIDFSGASFFNSWLDFARFNGASLSGANLNGTSLTGADLTNAVVTNGHFNFTNLTKQQLYSTASYQNHDLSGIDLGNKQLAGWDLSGQQLSGATLSFSDVSGMDLTDAFVAHANFNNSGLIQGQLFSTASYKNHDLAGIHLQGVNLTGASFAGMNLMGSDLQSTKLAGVDLSSANLSFASFSSTPLTSVNLTDAIVTHANFDSSASYLTPEQLYSTRSYKEHDLSGILLVHNNLQGWDFTGQNLTGAGFGKANLSFADLRGAIGFVPSAIAAHDAILPDGSIHGLSLLAGEHLVVRDYNLGITVQDALSFLSSSSLDVRFSAATWGSTLTLAPGVIPTLAGTLNLLFADGMAPAALIGTTYRLFNWNGQLPAGSHFDQILSGPGVVWDTSALYTTGDVTLTAVPEPSAAALFALGVLALFGSRAYLPPMGSAASAACGGSRSKRQAPYSAST